MSRAPLGSRLRIAEERLRARMWGLRRGVEVGERVRIGRRCRAIVERGARIVLEDGCVVDEATVLAAYRSGVLRLGRLSFVGRGCTLAAHRSVELGAGAFLAEFVSVRDHDHALGSRPSSGEVDVAPVRIGPDAWIGAKVTVVRGAEVGPGAVVGANALVRGEVPGRTLAAGVPVRVVRALEPAP